MVDHILPPPPPPPPPPPSPPPPGAPEVAYVEEYNEETQITRPETRQTANISTKRSKADVAGGKGGRDEFSDSGRSSQTVATLGSSATSSMGSNAGSNQPKIEKNVAASKRKPTNAEKMGKSRPHSPDKPSLQRTQSKSQKHRPCECTECLPQGRRTAPPQEHSKPQHSRSKTKPKALLSSLLRSTKPPPAQVSQPLPTAPPGRPRTSTTQYYRAPRPVSFHGGIMPDPVFIPQPPTPLIVQSQPSYPVSAPFPPPSYPPQQNPYFLPPLPPQDIYATSYPAQPPLNPRQWTSGYHPPRPQSMYYVGSEPTIAYGEKPIYTTIAPDIHPPSRRASVRERPREPPDEYPIRPEDYYKMRPPPPPKLDTKPHAEARPPMVRHAHTISDAHPTSRHRRDDYDGGLKRQASKRSPVKQSFAEHERSRRPEARSAQRSDESVPVSHDGERGTVHVKSGSDATKQRRRASVYGYETLQDSRKIEAIEAYQASRGTALISNPLPIDSLVRRKKTHASNSDTSSRQSGKSEKSRASREGSDVKSRRPSSDVKSRNDNDGLAMRFKPTQAVNIEMKEGVQGRTISLRQSKDGEGDMELGIGSRGRPVGSRPAITGRQKSRRSYSYVDGQEVTEVAQSRPSSRASRGYTYLDSKGQGVTHLERVRTRSSAAESIEEEREPRIISERTIETIRTRRSSRSGYSVRG